MNENKNKNECEWIIQSPYYFTEYELKIEVSSMMDRAI